MLNYDVSEEFAFSLAYQWLHSGVDKRKATECILVHGVNEFFVTMRETGLLIQELAIKVAAVVGRFL